MNLHAAAEAQASATPSPSSFSALVWQQGFAALGSDYFTELRPTPLPDPHWIAVSHKAADLLNLDAAWTSSDDALQVLAGNTVAQGSRPLASVYSGH